MIELAHEIIRDQTMKRSGYKTPPQIDNALYRGLIDLFVAGEPRSARYLKEVSYNIGTTHKFTLPPDFNKEANIFSLIGGKKHEGDILDEKQFTDRINSFILGPELTRPVARIIGTVIEFYPVDAGNFILSYYRTPIKPKFNFTSPSGRNIVYNPTGSVELDIDSGFFNLVVQKALFYLGVSLKAENLMMDGNQP